MRWYKQRTKENSGKTNFTGKKRASSKTRLRKSKTADTNKCAPRMRTFPLTSELWRHHSGGDYEPDGGRTDPRTAVLAAVEWFPREYTLLIPTPQGWGGLRGCNAGLRRLFVHGTQGGAVSLQSLFPEIAQSQSVPTSDCHTQRCTAKRHGEFT